jgi:hypothetical protein
LHGWEVIQQAVIVSKAGFVAEEEMHNTERADEEVGQLEVAERYEPDFATDLESDVARLAIPLVLSTV